MYANDEKNELGFSELAELLSHDKNVKNIDTYFRYGTGDIEHIGMLRYST